MTNYAQNERHALADLLDKVGPDAPTLCEGWQTADLAAHLVLRERRPDAAAGMVVPPLAAYTARVQHHIRDSYRWPDLVDKVRHGPPAVLALVDTLANTVEFFVHHEDVRRASPGWEPRTLEEDEEAALWRRLTASARALFRHSPVRVVLDSPGHGHTLAKKGDPEVTLSGPPSELVLFGFGRQRHTKVEVAGPEEAAERLRRASLGI